MALKSRQIACIEAMLAYPSASYVELAEMVGCNRNTITKWKNDEEFMAEYQKRLREMWKDSEAIAVKNMIKLAEGGCFQANKYILDSMNYAPAQRIEADINTEIVITIEE
jgi:uncharacterized protein YjcR